MCGEIGHPQPMREPKPAAKKTRSKKPVAKKGKRASKARV